MEFVKISKGSFYMGNSIPKTSGSDSETQHLVTLTHDFWIGRMEVTQEQWQKVMGYEEPHPENLLHSEMIILSILLFVNLTLMYKISFRN